MDLNSISQISNIGNINNVNNNNSINNSNTNSFQELLKNAVADVNESQIQGYSAMEGIATGNVVNLQEAVQRIEEAELSLKLALEVKNKAIGSFKEVMKMQV